MDGKVFSKPLNVDKIGNTSLTEEEIKELDEILEEANTKLDVKRDVAYVLFTDCEVGDHKTCKREARTLITTCILKCACCVIGHKK